ncbi:hypothetical protein JW935_11600 [candidate division KSB1 bacterium]|nr:hypothetical protein [candidate division KSB1 bacterium]
MAHERSKIKAALFTLFLYILFYLYIWLRIEPVLIYQRQLPVFLKGFRFFSEFNRYPGGIVDYIAGFFRQFFYYSWAGAIILTLLLLTVSTVTSSIMNSGQKKTGPRFIHHIPAVLLLVLHSNYHHHLSHTIALLITLLFVRVFLATEGMRDIYRLVIFWVQLFVVYYLTAANFILFSVIVIINCTVVNKKLFALTYLIPVLLLPYLASLFLFVVSPKQVYTYLLPFEEKYAFVITPFLLYGYFVFLLPLLHFVKPGRFKLKQYEQVTGWKKFAVPAVLLTFFAGLAAFFSFDAVTNNLIKVDYYARQQRWQDVLLAVTQNGSYLPAEVYQANRALYHLDKMPSELFSIPQPFGTDGLMLSEDYALSAPLQNSDLYFEMGHINESLHWAHEELAKRGPTPWVLHRLATLNMIKGEYNAARKFLYVLKQTLFYNKWAEDRLEQLDSHSIDQSSVIRYYRTINIDKDFYFYATHSAAELKVLLEKNPNNRIAFEYYMSYYLLECQLGNFIRYLPLLAQLKYPAIPRHYEEAILFYEVGSRKKVNLGPYKLSSATFERFKNFNQILADHNRDRDAAQQELKAAHGDTFWYYLLYYKMPKNNAGENESQKYGEVG